MAWSILSLIVVLLASSAIECAKSYKKSEICPCVPLNICPEINRFNKEDAKYFATILKCQKVGYVRCCSHADSVNRAMSRSDDAENIILVEDVTETVSKDSLRTNVVGDDITPEHIPEFITEISIEEITTVETTDEPEARTLEDDSLTVTENIEITTETESEVKRRSKSIDNSISVIYPNHKYPEIEKKKELMEHLFLIFPNGEIESALADSVSNQPFIPIADPQIPSETPTKRVIVRKRLIKRPSESLDGAESKISQAVIEPQKMDVEEVKKRITIMLRQNRRKNNLLPTSTTTTESPVEETTVPRQRRKKIRYRKQKPTTIASTTAHLNSATTLKARKEKIHTSTVKSRGKIIYDTRSRTNFLKRPSSSNADDGDEQVEPEVTTKMPTTTQKPEIYSLLTTALVTPTTTSPVPLIFDKHSNRIDYEHKTMIETVHKTLSAIHSGVDMKLVEKMLESHKTRMNEIRKNPPTTIADAGPTKPYRGSARFRQPAVTQPAPDHRPSHELSQATITRTRNLSRTRNTATTQTTHKSVRKVPRTFVTQPAANAVINSETLLEEIDMPPRQKAPLDFKASPLYGITMDKFNEFDNDMINKIHETLRPETKNQGGFFPVIHNGTPSTLL